MSSFYPHFSFLDIFNAYSSKFEGEIQYFTLNHTHLITIIQVAANHPIVGSNAKPAEELLGI